MYDLHADAQRQQQLKEAGLLTGPVSTSAILEAMSQLNRKSDPHNLKLAAADYAVVPDEQNTVSSTV